MLGWFEHAGVEFGPAASTHQARIGSSRGTFSARSDAVASRKLDCHARVVLLIIARAIGFRTMAHAGDGGAIPAFQPNTAPLPYLNNGSAVFSGQNEHEQ